jgi:hypothetical protein
MHFVHMYVERGPYGAMGSCCAHTAVLATRNSKLCICFGGLARQPSILSAAHELASWLAGCMLLARLSLSES